MLKNPIRMHMNEMPFLPPDSVLEAAQQGAGHIHRYADFDDMRKLRRKLSEYSGVAEARVFLSPGSDILLREIVLLFARGRKLVLVSPSFMPAAQAARGSADTIINLRLTPPEFSFQTDHLLQESQEPSLIIIENPNNPTGRILLDRSTIEGVLENQDAVLVIDEAYYEFSGVTCADLVSRYPNLAVTRTLDKAFSLAGARVGYMLAGDRFVKAFTAFTAILPQTGLRAAMAALDSSEYVMENIHLIERERERMRKELISMGIPTADSAANFMLLSTRCSNLGRRLEEKGILVADVSSQLPHGCIRVTVGTEEENNAFLAGMREIMGENA